MKTYFNNVNTLEELRKQYKELLKKFHPDNPNGSTEATQEINAEYDSLFTILKDRHDTEQTADTEHKESAYNANMYDWENDKAIRDILQKIINFSGIDIEIIGQWVWVFNSYEYRKELKEMNFKYASKKQAWYFHTETFRKQGKKALSINEIRNYYGSTKIQKDERKAIEA